MREVVDPVVAGLRADGHEYRGFLYAGLMLTCDGPKVIEFNVRFGDPEAQVVIPMIADDLAPRLAAAAEGALDERADRIPAGAARRRRARVARLSRIRSDRRADFGAAVGRARPGRARVPRRHGPPRRRRRHAPAAAC